MALSTATQQLRHAAQRNNVDVVQSLLSNGVDPNAVPPNCDGENALHTAALNGCNDVVRLLLQHDGMNINACEQSYNMTAGHTAISYTGLGTCAFFLLPDGGQDAVHCRGQDDPMYTLSLLVVYGIDKQAEDTTGMRIAKIEQCSSWLYMVAMFQLHCDARYVLKHRDVVDPDEESYKQICAARELARADAATYMLINDAASGWRPRTHWLYHRCARSAVHTIFLVALRQTERNLSLPPEIWQHILHFIQRKWWTLKNI